MLSSINAEQSTQLSQVLTTLSRIECRNAFQPGRSASDWIQILLKHAAIGWLYLNFKQGFPTSIAAFNAAAISTALLTRQPATP
jgi:hypothetical protein